ncbi:hypothetical protein JCM3765_006137 [Sporobolomyces pararoseus]
MQIYQFDTAICPSLEELLAQLEVLRAQCDTTAAFSFVRGRLTCIKSYLESCWNEQLLTNQLRAGIFKAIQAAVPSNKEEIIKDPSKVPTLFDTLCSATLFQVGGPLAWPIGIPRKVFDASLTDLYQGSGKNISDSLRKSVQDSAMFHSWDTLSPESRMRAWSCLEWARRSVMRLRNVWLQVAGRPPPRALAHIGVVKSLLECFLEHTLHPSLSSRVGVWVKDSEQNLDELAAVLEELYVLADQDVRPRLWTILSCFTLAWHNPHIQVEIQQAIIQEIKGVFDRIKEDGIQAGGGVITHRRGSGSRDTRSRSPRDTPLGHQVRQRSPHERAAVFATRDHSEQAESSASTAMGPHATHNAVPTTQGDDKEEWLDWLDLSPSPR